MVGGVLDIMHGRSRMMIEGVKGVLDIIHGRSRMHINPRLPTMPGRSTWGFSPTRQTLLAPSAKRRQVFGESHKG